MRSCWTFAVASSIEAAWVVQISVVAPEWDGSVHRATTWYSCFVRPSAGVSGGQAEEDLAVGDLGPGGQGVAVADDVAVAVIGLEVWVAGSVQAASSRS